jgi:hypothetical protein
MSPTAKLRIPGHRVRAARLHDEAQYGGMEVKKETEGACGRNAVAVRAASSIGGGGGQRTLAPFDLPPIAWRQ